MSPAVPMRGMAAIPIEEVRPSPSNIRSALGDLTDLTASIRGHGILQPLVVEDRVDHYQIIAGHRRHAAAKAAGLTHVPCIIRSGTGSATQNVRQIMENVHRDALEPLDEARAYQALERAGMTRMEIAAATGVRAARVADRLALLALPAAAQTMVATKQLPLGQARDLARQVKATRTGTVTPPSRSPAHFTRGHRLAGEARLACDLAGHPLPGRLHDTACGACWEATIRADTTPRPPEKTP